MSLPDQNQPRGRTIASVSVDGALSQPLRLGRFDGGLCGWRRQNVVFLADTLAPTWDTLLLLIPLETSRTRHDQRGIRGREVKRQRQEEWKKQQMAHRELF